MPTSITSSGITFDDATTQTTSATKAGGIGTTQLADSSVTTAKIADANVTPAKLSQPYTLATSQASTSGTSIEFTGIPSWAKRITVMLNGVSTNGTTFPLIRVGSGSIASSGYVSQASLIYGTNLTAVATFTTGIGIYSNQASDTMYGHLFLTLVTGTTWLASGVVNIAGRTSSACTSGSVTLSGALDRVSITTTNGTDTFDAGTINIAYEG